MERRHVLLQVFDIIKLIGKQSPSYRSSSKALYDIENSNVNHGNLLKLLKFTAKCDIVLNKYLTYAIQRSKQRKQQVKSSTKGRGALITPKITINKVIDAKVFSEKNNKE